MAEQVVKLIITDHGDPSVGMRSRYWEIEYPFEIDPDDWTQDEEDNLRDFKNEIYRAYKPFAEGRMTADWDFILRKEAEQEAKS